MPSLLDNAPQSLSAASARLLELRRRARQMVEWFVALVVLGVVLWLDGSPELAGSVAAGAVTAVVIGGLAVDERSAITPPAVALCQRLLTDGAGSPLYNPQLPDRELDRVLAVVEAGVTHVDRIAI